MKAYAEAVEYGIDVGQLEFLLTLTPAQRLRRHDAAFALVRAAREGVSEPMASTLDLPEPTEGLQEISG